MPSITNCQPFGCLSHRARPRLGWAAAIAPLVSVLLSGTAHAQATISSLFNTGVNASGTVLANGTIDPHYLLTSATSFTPANSNTYVVNNGAYVQNASSAYIAPDATDGGQENGGNYTTIFTTTFTLPSNTNLASVNIAGNWATDNTGTDIIINGHSTGFSSSGFGSFTAFTVPTGYYTTGTNTLAFNWTNTSGPGGLNVYYTVKSYATSPEPGSVALLASAALGGLPMVGMVVARRRRKAA